MKAWGITRRWILNSLGIIVLVLVTLIITLSFVVQSYVYNGIQQTINGRSGELTNVFSGYGKRTASEFSASARNYVENSPSKETMEMMVLNSQGKIIITSTGFAPDQDQPMPDYRLALQSPDGYGTWKGKLSSGEKVMAVTRLIRNDNGSVLGGIRYAVSLEEADRQVFTIVGLLMLAGCLIILFVIFSSTYFIKSIVGPIKQIGATAKRIAQGDFNARIEHVSDDEIGELCRTINDMAVELGTAEKMKNDFISSVSHELRTPLTAIKGWAETMQQFGENDRENYEKGMGVIIRESERLSGIVEELLDFSRMQSGRMSLTMDKIDILAELGEAVYMFSERAQTEGKFLLYEEPAMLSPVLGDINRLRQVFVNIIDNALKYTKSGDTINVTAEEKEGKIFVVISDNGCGIPAKDLPNVKKKFYKANQTVRGSGIGLALADEIMALHSGSLTIESQEGVGTSVTITIPTLKQPHPEPEPAPAAEERKPENNG
ncbi:Sensor histidine kinase [Ruminococcaceae bacterium BL-6]|nr:Sensor histidine kinase [Ruminococcaceae bacterium BL-6]